MATINTQVQVRLAWYARWLLIVAAVLAKYTPLRIPHRAVVSVANRSWSMRIGTGQWRRVRIDDRGRVVG